MARLYSQACERNRAPLLEVLMEVLPSEGTLLEIAAGTGMHGAWMAPRLPGLVWRPTDVDEGALESIRAWRDEVDAENLLPPLRLDVTSDWPVERADAILCANMIHISPWPCTRGLFAGGERVLPAGAPLVTYGPYRRGGETAPSNERFHESLVARDPSWGVRDLEAVEGVATEHQFHLERVVEMPANNLTVVFRRNA